MFWSDLDTGNVKVPIGVYLVHRPIILSLIVIFILLYVIIVVGCLTGTGTLAVPIHDIVDFFCLVYASYTIVMVLSMLSSSTWHSPSHCYQMRHVHS
jgi:hypothetical protein